MSGEKFDGDPYFKEWVYASNNYRQRRWGIRAFCRYAKLSPSELIYERQADLGNGEPLFRVRAENRLRKFLKWLERRDAGYNKRRNLFNLIKNFYAHFGLDLNMKRSDAPRGESGRVYPFTLEIFQRVLAVCDARERAIVLLTKDCGQAASEISRLTLAHLGSDGENLNPEDAPIPVRLTRKKTRSKVHSFVGDEAIEALNVYFDLRRRGTADLYKGRWRGEKGLQPEMLTGLSPVIARKCGGHLSSERMSGIVGDLIRKAGVGANVRFHGIRRFFETAFERPEVGVHPAWIKRMMGHKLSQNERAYSHPSDEQLREAYLRGYRFLRVFGEPVDVEQLKVERMHREDLGKRVIELEEHNVRLERELADGRESLRLLADPEVLRDLRWLRDRRRREAERRG